MSSTIARVAFRAVLVTVCGCGAAGIVGLDNESQRISVSVGQEITVTLGNVGPGTYESPPQMSSDALSYIGVEVIPPFTPAGPTQQFRFKAVRRGQSVVVFRRSLADAIVAEVRDTIDVH